MSAGTKDSQYFKSFNFQAKSAHVTGLTLSFLFFSLFHFVLPRLCTKVPYFMLQTESSLISAKDWWVRKLLCINV